MMMKMMVSSPYGQLKSHFPGALNRGLRMAMVRRTPVSFRVGIGLILLLGTASLRPAPLCAQLEQLEVREGVGIPNEVRAIYQKGADYLAKTQSNDGSWSGNGNSHGEEAPGICALSVMAFLSTGEDPNFGRYASNIRSALRYIILHQNPKTGYIPGNMYVHGFSMLALSEAYGAVDDERLWPEGTDPEKRRTIAEALELAIRLAVTAQKKNPNKGWRYSPGDPSADTSVVGAVLMGLLAARNAGMDVPDESIDGALEYMKSMTSADSGEVGYSGLGGFGESGARTSIACLVFSIGKRKDWKELEGTRKYLVDHLLISGNSGWAEYERYYKAQALFQADFDSWKKWNDATIRELKAMQNADGQIGSGSQGPAYTTAMSLLALALNYRFLPIYER